MIDFSRYCQIWYRAQRSLQNHCLIQDGTREVLSKQDCEYVHQRDNFLSRYTQLSLVGKQRSDDMRCFRVNRSNQETSTIRSPEWICAQAINPLDLFLTIWQKEHYLRCEVWLLLRTGQKHCFRGVKNGIREVACA
ncbi:MAG: hypothetical protein WC015_07210 [Methanoregula sp.]